MWKEYHTTKRMKTFTQFLQGVKYGFLKTIGDLDMLTMQKEGSDSPTLWEELKATGKYEINLDGVAVDLEFERCIYIAVKIN